MKDLAGGSARGDDDRGPKGTWWLRLPAFLSSAPAVSFGRALAVPGALWLLAGAFPGTREIAAVSLLASGPAIVWLAVIVLTEAPRGLPRK